MLEHQELWLGPWSVDEPRRRPIAVAHARTPLGEARWHPRPASALQRWWTPPSLEVVETEDESLVFTVRRFWGWTRHWEVFDADDHCLGSVSRAGVYDRLGRSLARLDQPAGSRGWRLLSPEGPELASAEDAGDGCVFAFTSFVEENPFARMLLLAVVLVPEEG